MGTTLKVLHDLSISKKGEDHLFNDVLEDKVLVIVAEFDDISLEKVVQGELPLIERLSQLSVVVDFLLGDICVEDLAINAVSERRGDTSLGVLDKKGLVIFGQKALTDEDPFINETLIFIDSYLPIGNIKFVVFLS